MNSFLFVLKSIVLNGIVGALVGSLFGLIYFSAESIHPHMPFPYWLICSLMVLAVALGASLITSVILALLNRLKMGVVSMVTASAIIVFLIVFVFISRV